MTNQNIAVAAMNTGKAPTATATATATPSHSAAEQTPSPPVDPLFI